MALKLPTFPEYSDYQYTIALDGENWVFRFDRRSGELRWGIGPEGTVPEATREVEGVFWDVGPPGVLAFLGDVPIYFSEDESLALEKP